MFSKTCEYGIKAVLYIAVRSLKNERVKIGDIVEHIGSPEAFTGKILGVLSKNNIVASYTGPNGGFEIDRDRLNTISLADIVSAIDGDALFDGCALGLDECDDQHPCPMHESFSLMRNQLRDMLRKTTVYELAIGLEKGESLLMR
ncbi:MAG: Rrf2 family transcriptional regulator [Petrimonas sp.]|nr:Rrf2 family transcriptional regulator [Petrimonas sp.]